MCLRALCDSCPQRAPEETNTEQHALVTGCNGTTILLHYGVMVIKQES